MLVSAISLFCEDIRQEIQGTETLVGVLPDGLNIIGKPGVVGKLAVYTKIFFPVENAPNFINIKFIGADGNLIMSATCDKDQIDQIVIQANASRMNRAGLKNIFVISGLQINDSGKFMVTVDCDGDKITSGVLKIGLLEFPNPATATFEQPLP